MVRIHFKHMLTLIFVDLDVWLVRGKIVKMSRKKKTSNTKYAENNVLIRYVNKIAYKL